MSERLIIIDQITGRDTVLSLWEGEEILDSVSFRSRMDADALAFQSGEAIV